MKRGLIIVMVMMLIAVKGEAAKKGGGVTSPTRTQQYIMPPAYEDTSEKQLTSRAVMNIWDGGGLSESAEEPENWIDDYTPWDGEMILFNETSVKNTSWDYLMSGSLYQFVIEQGYTGVITVTKNLDIRDTMIISGGKVVVSSGKLVIGEDTETIKIRIMLGAAGILAALIFWYAVISAS